MSIFYLKIINKANRCDKERKLEREMLLLLHNYAVGFFFFFFS